MRPGAIVNISDYKSDLHCRDGQVIEVAEEQVVVMFLVLNKKNGVNCIIERFKMSQVYEMKNIKELRLIGGYK